MMTQDVPQVASRPLFILHKGLGPIVLVVVLLRLGWRAFHPAPPLPASVRRCRRGREDGAWRFISSDIQAVSGYVRVRRRVSHRGLEALGIPPSCQAEGVGKIASGVHQASANCLILLIVMHVARPLSRIVRRDGVCR